MSNRRNVWFARISLVFLVLLVFAPVLAIFISLLPWLLVGVSFEASDGRSASPESFATNRGAYYRITARYLVDHVEPLDFDLVVACDENRPKTALSDWGLLPAVYAKRTQYDHAVLVAVPDFCGDMKGRNLGQIGGVADGSFLPLTIWFDEAGILEFGLGYASIQAFDSPLARLTFLEATVRYASREEFEEWYEHQNHNLIQSDLMSLDPVETNDLTELGKDVLPQACHGIGFVRVNEQAHRVLERVWHENRPRFWYTTQIGKQAWQNLQQELFYSQTKQFVSYDQPEAKYQKLDWYLSGAGRSFSNLNRSKLSNYLDFEFVPTEFYPVYFNDSVPLSREERDSSFFSANIDMRPETKGFVACYTRVSTKSASKASEPKNTKQPDSTKLDLDSSFELKINGEPQLLVNGVSSLSGYLIIEAEQIGKFSSFSYRKFSGKVN